MIVHTPWGILDDINAASEAARKSSQEFKIKPLPNPLSNYSSYTYQITLYMSTPEAINNFIKTGVFNTQDDHFIVAQSGGIGINEKRAMTNDGTPGPNKSGLDYYIDDLDLKLILTGADGSATIGTDIKFKIIEPIGFNFFDNLEKISGFINNKSEIIQQSNTNKTLDGVTNPSPIMQNYMIGIRFYGYDSTGKLVAANNHPNFYKKNKLEPISTISPSANFERFFTFQVSEMVYQIDGRVITYNITGVPIAKQIGQGSKFGLTLGASTIIADTVEGALIGSGSKKDLTRGIIDILNDQELSKVETKQSKHANSFNVVFVGDANTTIAKSAISGDFMPTSQAPFSPTVDKPQDVTPKNSFSANSFTPLPKSMTIPAGTPVIMLMDELIAKSTYVTNKLIIDNNQAIETRTKPNSSVTEITWYSINPVVTILGRDEITKDWYYNITYYINLQKIEYVRAMYVKHEQQSKFYGPYKKYEYFLTGQNSEIISFEQAYNNQFYLLQSLTTSSVEKNKQNVVPTHVVGGTVNKPIAGELNRGSDPAAEVKLRMNSVADQATANIKILGDPHYIMGNVGGIQIIYNDSFQKRYNLNADTMNPYNNQIWIEIVFNGATDYQFDGTLKLRDIDFYGMIDPRGAPNNKLGMIYRVISVDSFFTGGRFTQTLELILVLSQDLNLSDEDKIVASEREKAEKKRANLRLANQQLKEIKAKKLGIPTSQLPADDDLSVEQLQKIYPNMTREDINRIFKTQIPGIR